MMLGLIAVAVLAAPAIPFPAEPPLMEGTSVASLLAKVEQLRGLGDGANDSPLLAEIKAEVAGVTRAYRASLRQQQLTGEPPHSCPPPRSGLTSSNLFAALAEVPLENRHETSVQSVYFEMMKKRYPCSGS